MEVQSGVILHVASGQLVGVMMRRVQLLLSSADIVEVRRAPM